MSLLIDCERAGNWNEIAAAVAAETKQRAPLSAELVFVDEAEIRRLNRETRGLDKVTDVLSYPTLNGIRGVVIDAKQYPFDTEAGRVFIGSIAICSARAAEQAEEYGHSERREITYLFIHGLLHLLGYDHIEDDDRREMRALEKRVLARLEEEEV